MPLRLGKFSVFAIQTPKRSEARAPDNNFGMHAPPSASHGKAFRTYPGGISGLGVGHFYRTGSGAVPLVDRVLKGGDTVGVGGCITNYQTAIRLRDLQVRGGAGNPIPARGQSSGDVSRGVIHVGGFVGRDR